MQSGEHQVTGQSRLYADFRSFEVADLADKNNIGVLAEVFLVEQPHDDLVAVQCGHGGHTEVQFLLLAFRLVLDHDAAVLGQALFRDVQLGHDLYAAGYGVLQAHGRRHDGLELSVNSETHAQFRLVGLNVDVARAALYGVGQNQVDELDDGSFFGGFFERRRIEL